MSTVAIHAIWTTYLTWPPGDERGHWSALFDLYGRLLERGHKLRFPIVKPDDGPWNWPRNPSAC